MKKYEKIKIEILNLLENDVVRLSGLGEFELIEGDNDRDYNGGWN